MFIRSKEISSLSLQAIKLATSQESFGDKLPEEYMKDAEELYHLRIPERFRHLAGNSSPPNSWALTAWLSDLQARFNQMEKILYQVFILNLQVFSVFLIALNSISQVISLYGDLNESQKHYRVVFSK